MKVKEKVMEIVFLVAACVSILAVLLICVFLFSSGIPAIAKIGPLNFLGGTVWKPSNNLFGILPMILGSIYVTAGAIIIGAYDARTFTYADFSGRGPADENTFWETAKPDLVAPGVAVRSVATGGGYAEYTGTSFAVPFVTGSAALLMEWGIIKGNDPYLYGEKVKAYLRRGARELPGFAEYPNNQVGYGRLCLERSLPD